MKDMILDYIQNEYLDEDEADDIDARREHPAHLERHRRQLQHGEPEAVPREEVRRSASPTRRPRPQAFDTVTSIIALVNKHLAKKGA